MKKVSLIGEVPSIFPKDSTKKFVEVNTGEVIYVPQDTNEVYYQKDLADSSQLNKV